MSLVVEDSGRSLQRCAPAWSPTCPGTGDWGGWGLGGSVENAEPEQFVAFLLFPAKQRKRRVPRKARERFGQDMRFVYWEQQEGEDSFLEETIQDG